MADVDLADDEITAPIGEYDRFLVANVTFPSVSVEHLFSKSRHLCTDLQCSLKVETIKDAILKKIWIKSGLPFF
jgi:hypothetical protein